MKRCEPYSTLFFVGACLANTCCFSTVAGAQSSGTVIGRVTNAATSRTLPGANVVVDGTRRGDATDRSGEFRIVGVSEGRHRLIFSYLGFSSDTLDVTVNAGRTVFAGTVAMQVSTIEMEPLVVQGVRLGQARALNQQKTADRIVNVVASDLIGRFPDPNTAEAVQRIPGVSVARDHGEGRYVMVRGTEPRLTAVTINGEQIPTPEGESRQVALDVIPADQLASIEVNKALTPEMDADGIGGSVNLVTREAFDAETVLKATLTSGYSSLIADGSSQGALTYGKRVGSEGKLGYLLSGSYYRTTRGTDNNEFEWGDADFGAGDVKVLEDFELRDYIITRERTGLSGTLDYRYDRESSVYLRGIFNRFGDHEYRRRLRLRFGKGDFDSPTQVSDARVERELKNRYEVQDIYSLKTGGRHAFSGLDVDYSASFSYAQEDEPDRRDMTFLQKKVDLSYDISDPRYPTYAVTNGIDIHDPAAFDLDEMVVENNLTWERNLMVRLDLEAPFNLNAAPGAFRFGAKARSKRRERENDSQVMDSFAGGLTMAAVASDIESRPLLDGRYVIGRSPDPGKVDLLYATEGTKFEVDINGSREDTDPANYSATEDVYAAYAQTRLSLGRWMLLTGARYEWTGLRYTGNEVIFDENGDYEATNGITGKNSYGQLFPMAHLKYAIGHNTNLRLAATRSLARPNYYDVVPYQLVFREDELLERGNVDLKPTTALNLDLMLEHYFSTVGLVAGGLFYKRLDDYIFVRVLDEAGGPFTGFAVRQPVNGGRRSYSVSS